MKPPSVSSPPSRLALSAPPQVQRHHLGAAPGPGPAIPGLCDIQQGQHRRGGPRHRPWRCQQQQREQPAERSHQRSLRRRDRGGDRSRRRDEGVEGRCRGDESERRDGAGVGHGPRLMPRVLCVGLREVVEGTWSGFARALVCLGYKASGVCMSPWWREHMFFFLLTDTHAFAGARTRGSKQILKQRTVVGRRVEDTAV